MWTAPNLNLAWWTCVRVPHSVDSRLHIITPQMLIRVRVKIMGLIIIRTG
jgi:hypothetical protein